MRIYFEHAWMKFLRNVLHVYRPSDFLRYQRFHNRK